jgi:hypothetical protein
MWRFSEWVREPLAFSGCSCRIGPFGNPVQRPCNTLMAPRSQGSTDDGTPDFVPPFPRMGSLLQRIATIDCHLTRTWSLPKFVACVDVSACYRRHFPPVCCPRLRRHRSMRATVELKATSETLGTPWSSSVERRGPERSVPGREDTQYVTSAKCSLFANEM